MQKLSMVNKISTFTIKTGSVPVFVEPCLTYLTVILALDPIKLYLYHKLTGQSLPLDVLTISFKYII